jgi:hypothetical protein
MFPQKVVVVKPPFLWSITKILASFTLTIFLFYLFLLVRLRTMSTSFAILSSKTNHAPSSVFISGDSASSNTSLAVLSHLLATKGYPNPRVRQERCCYGCFRCSRLPHPALYIGGQSREPVVTALDSIFISQYCAIWDFEES